MALPKVANSSKLLVRIGNGASPEVFTHYCLINTNRGIVFSSNPTESLIPDCDAPDEPGWIDREPDSMSASITGAGMLDTASHKVFWNWFISGDAKNIQVALDVPGADGGGYWQGSAVLTDYTIAGPGRREKITFDCTILSDGPLTWVDA